MEALNALLICYDALVINETNVKRLQTSCTLVQLLNQRRMGGAEVHFQPCPHAKIQKYGAEIRKHGQKYCQAGQG